MQGIQVRSIVASEIPREIQSNDDDYLPQAAKLVSLKVLRGRIKTECDVKIHNECNRGGYHISASEWRNPYSYRKFGVITSLRYYKRYILNSPLKEKLPQLKGKTLGCICRGKVCHGKVLVDIVNSMK